MSFISYNTIDTWD